MTYANWKRNPRFTQCTAQSKQKRQRCGNDAIPGGTVCTYHGGAAAQVQGAADARLRLKEAFERGDRRPAWQILADTLHSADVLMLDARLRLIDGEAITIEQLDRFLEALDRAQRFAKQFVDVGIDERRVRATEAATAQLAEFLRRALARSGLTAEQCRTVELVLAEEIRGNGPAAIAA